MVLNLPFNNRHVGSAYTAPASKAAAYRAGILEMAERAGKLDSVDQLVALLELNLCILDPHFKGDYPELQVRTHEAFLPKHPLVVYSCFCRLSSPQYF